MEYLAILIGLVLAPVIVKMVDRAYATSKKTEFGKDLNKFLIGEE